MIREFKLDRCNLASSLMPMRFTLDDVKYFFGEELKEEGFDLEMELQFSVNYRPDLIDEIIVRVTQDDRFRVRPVNSFYPFAII